MAYLAPLAGHPSLAPSIHYRNRVVSLARRGHEEVKTGTRSTEPFIVTVETPTGLERNLASAVIDASGTWTNHNPLGSSGVSAPGERELADRIGYGLPDVLGADRKVYAGATVMVAGAGHSAADVILEVLTLADAETTTNWRLPATGVCGAGATSSCC